MGVVSVNTKYGPLNFSIKGEKPSATEQLRIQDVLIDKESYFSKEEIEAYDKKQKGQNVKFDYKTGIQDKKLRRMLGRADTAEDQEKVLMDGFGLTRDQFTRDNRGNLALMPEAAQKFGVESSVPVMIDESGLTMRDLSDLSGMGTTIGGAVAGAIAGQAAIPVPILGAVVGATLGGGGGKALEETIESAQGVQAQELSDIAKDVGKEALISGAGEGIFGVAGKAYRVLRGTDRVGKGVPEERIGDILAADKRGYKPTATALNVPSLVARQQALAEKTLGTSKRLRDNHENIMRDLARYREGLATPSVEGTASILGQAAKTGTKDLKGKVGTTEKALLKHMDDIAVQLGKAADQDLNINEDLFKIFEDSYKEFGIQIDKSFENISKAIDDNIGKAGLFNTKGIVEDAKILLEDKVAAQANTSDAEAKSILQTIIKLGDEASFAQLYTARKSLRQADFNSIESDTVKIIVNKLMPRIDDQLNIKNIEGLIGKGTGRPTRAGASFTKEQRNTLKQASRDLDKARGMYKEGNQKFEAVKSAIEKKDLISKVRDPSAPFNPSGLSNKLVRADNPKLLADAEKAVNKFKGEGAFDPIKKRIGSEWMRKALKNSTDSKNGKWSGAKFKDKIDGLGSTADELFGANTAEIKKLAEQMNALSLRNVDESVIAKFSEAGADDAAVGLLRNLSKELDELSVFTQNQVMKKLTKGQLTPTEAAEYLASGSVRAEDIKALKSYFANSADDMNTIRSYYMESLIGDFEKAFLTDKTQFVKLGNNFAKDKAKIKEIFGEQMGEDMLEFGRIMKLLGESAPGGDLVAANIAASPLENLGTIARLSVVGSLFSSGPFYSTFLKKFKTAARGADPKTKGQIAGELISDAIKSSMGQSVVQAADESINSAVDQASSMIQSSKKPKRSSSTMPVPNVQPSPVNLQPQRKQTSNVRQRARENPAAAATLLGGLGSAGLL